MNRLQDTTFKKTVLDHWRDKGRHDLPWRKTKNPYHILVSEIMLQQTQVDRVIPKYHAFLKEFPTFRALAKAPTAKVLKTWQGLGYNRRALMLQRCAQVVVHAQGGALPNTREALVALPGIGPYTAGAVLAFAFNRPHPVIETNIRRVYLHHYFPRSRSVGDDRILTVVERTMDHRDVRRWYWALMDYGATLAKTISNPNKRSKHYTRQSTFEGSNRQIRGAIIRQLVGGGALKVLVLAKNLDKPATDVEKILLQLEREGFIVRCSHARCVHKPHWSLAR